MPREGHDVGETQQHGYNYLIFLSTCPVRGTTSLLLASWLGLLISIHVPREGHDHQFITFSRGSSEFLSTCPVRGTTVEPQLVVYPFAISIHVPREGHDRHGCELP